MLSPVVERDINEYYKARNGTPAGVPVVVLGINTDMTSQTKTDSFIRSVGFDLVLDDPSWKGYAQFGPGNSASRYVIINGLSDSPSHKQWEVLFNDVYFQPRQPETVRAIIERVKPAVATLPKISYQSPSLVALIGSTVTLTVSANGTAPLAYQWRKNGAPIPNATSAALILQNVTLNDAGDYSAMVSNALGSEIGQVISLKVTEPMRPVLGGMRRIAGGGVEFLLTGEPGRNYHIEFSSDLKTWKRLATLPGSEQKVPYLDSNASVSLQGFYRAVGE